MIQSTTESAAAAAAAEDDQRPLKRNISGDFKIKRQLFGAIHHHL